MSGTKKTVIVTVAAILLALLAAGAGFGFYYFNRPILKINNAIQEKDIETVNDLYGSLKKESEILEVQDQMLDYATELSDDFIKGDIDYDSVQEQYDLLGENILDDNSRFNKLERSVNTLNNSRIAFKNGQKAYKSGDYEKAVEEFGKVIKDDENFDEAVAKIEECKQLLKPDVKGVYRTTIDLAKILAGYLDMSLTGALSIPINVDFVFEFTDDENGTAYLDIKDYDELADSVIKMVTVFAKKSIANELGASESDVDTYVKLIYGKSLEEVIADEANIDELKAMMPQDKVPFYYTVEDDEVIITSDSDDEKYIMSVHDGELHLDEASGNSIDELLDAGLELPLVFRKDK